MMKALTLSLCVIAILGSAASGYFWYEVGNQKKALQSQLSSEQARANDLQDRLTQATSELETTRTRLAEENAKLGDTQNRLTTSEAQNIRVQRELEETRRRLAAREETERRLNADLESLRRELVQARLSTQTGGNPEEVERLRQTIASLESRLAAQAAQLVATPAASGPAQSRSPSARATDSEILPAKSAANARNARAEVAGVGPRNAFVILNLTSADGIAVGDKFNIVRNGEIIATSTVSEIKQNLAIAQVAPASIRSALIAGDIATLVP